MESNGRKPVVREKATKRVNADSGPAERPDVLNNDLDVNVARYGYLSAKASPAVLCVCCGLDHSCTTALRLMHWRTLLNFADTGTNSRKHTVLQG